MYHLPEYGLNSIIRYEARVQDILAVVGGRVSPCRLSSRRMNRLAVMAPRSRGPDGRLDSNTESTPIHPPHLQSPITEEVPHYATKHHDAEEFATAIFHEYGIIVFLCPTEDQEQSILYHTTKVSCTSASSSPMTSKTRTVDMRSTCTFTPYASTTSLRSSRTLICSSPRSRTSLRSRRCSRTSKPWRRARYHRRSRYPS